MKKIFLLVLILSYNLILLAQQIPEFQFTLYAEDYLGNRDSVVIGYDSTAIEYDGFDPQFGEIDITNTPFDSVFELRASVFNSFAGGGQLQHQFFQTKKEIAKWQCYNKPFLNASIPLSVRTRNLPVRFSWDHHLFQDTCNQWMAMSEVEAWEIAGHHSLMTHALLQYNGYYVAFNNGSTTSEGVFNYIDSIEGGGTDTIYGITFYIWARNLLNSSTHNVRKDLQATVYPNPTSGLLHLEIPTDFKKVERLSIFRIDGQLIYQESVNRYDWVTDVGHLAEGVYFYILENEVGEVMRGKFVKNR